MRDIALVVSCEHASNRVPPEYAALFANAVALLDSHRGFDAGALEVARALAAAEHGTPLVEAHATRLLVDLNRSAGHPKLFSELTRDLPPEAKQRLIALHYTPYRSRVEGLVEEGVSRGSFVLHISSHSFTPVLDGLERNADVALLYDPGRRSEKAIAADWLDALAEAEPRWRLRRNYPYRGTADGLTTYLRTRFYGDVYAGLELEVSQRLVGASEWPRALHVIAGSLRRVLGDRAIRRGGAAV
jgi:predicted N-formylglutamate amidohydrolase